jgi:LPS-assembly protein
MRIIPLALAAGLLASGGLAQGDGPGPGPTAAAAPASAASGVALQPSLVLRSLPRGAAAAQLPTFLRAQSLTSQAELETVAEGKAEFRRGGLVIRADRLAYDSAQDLASAKGDVRVSRDGALYKGPELQLRVQRFEGFFLEPEFEFPLLGASGRAARIDFLDGARSRATRAEYTSCPRDDGVEPAWVLRTDSVRLDFDTNEGVAEGAVLRFLGTPILALPSLSFPLSDARKSGWLPPSVSTDNRSGVEFSMPYFWNIAPNRDATITPRIISKRGLGLDTEFRYLESQLSGVVTLDWLPEDRLARRSREALLWTHEGRLDEQTRYAADLVRVSDDGWWKDYPGATRSLTPRLLPLHLGIERSFVLFGGTGLAYARTTQWQVLQGADTAVVAPYERVPQLGLRLGGRAFGLQYSVETEYNRFSLPAGDAAQAGRSGGDRVHLLGALSWPQREAGWFLVPKVSVNAAAYNGASVLGESRSRVIPTLSLDTGLELERTTQAFGRAMRQTLEPRLLYVLTPYRAQSLFPNYDSAAKDFNLNSIYSDNQFSGVDRVNDANQLTAGVTSRFVDAASGAEALRVGLVQRFLFATQRETAQDDGTPDGAPVTHRLSDALLLASTTLLPRWTLDASTQYSFDLNRSVRSIVGVRYAPGPLRTLSVTYRMARGLNEQLELGWQWPIYGKAAGSLTGDASCRGTLYAVGRVNYSLQDSRITDSLFGAEYDAGCWIARLVAERLSTGSSQATTRLMLQLELVGLSRIGSNPLKVLKDNIPGYRLLREERRSPSATDDRAPFYD